MATVAKVGLVSRILRRGLMKSQFKARLHHNSIVTQESYLQYKNFKDGCICHQTPYTGLFVNLYMNFSFYLLNLLLCTHFTLCTRSSSRLFFAFKECFKNCPNHPWLCPFLCSLTPVLNFRIHPKASLGAPVTVTFTNRPVLSHL